MRLVTTAILLTTGVASVIVLVTEIVPPMNWPDPMKKAADRLLGSKLGETDPWVTAEETLPYTCIPCPWGPGAAHHNAEPLFSATPGAACSTCPKNWLHFQQKCYYFGKGPKQWIQARFACSDLEGRLVSIHSQEEQVARGSMETMGSWIVMGGAGEVVPPWPSGMDRMDHMHLHLGLPDETHQQGFLDWPPGSQCGGTVHMDGREPSGLQVRGLRDKHRGGNCPWISTSWRSPGSGKGSCRLQMKERALGSGLPRFLSHKERMKGPGQRAARAVWKGGSWAACIEGVQKWGRPRHRAPKRGNLCYEMRIVGEDLQRRNTSLMAFL